MSVKAIFGGIVTIGLVALLFFYFMPFRNVDFEIGPTDSNFSTGFMQKSSMQFYPNMRYQSNMISYRISTDCSVKKREDAELALDILAARTVLNFYPVSAGEEILVTCDEKTKFEGNTFVAGEGGPTSIVRSGNYNVILEGMILLIRDSGCGTPNVAIHEFLHALGFIHSNNRNNIMYNFSDCGQTIGDDIPNLINEIYTEESLPNLAFENVSASVNNRYLDVGFTVRNEGLANAGDSVVLIKAGDDILKEVDIQDLDIGEGLVVGITDLFVPTFSFEEIVLEIDYKRQELAKGDNTVSLVIKK